MQRRALGLFSTLLFLLCGLILRLWSLSGQTGYASAVVRQSSYLLEVSKSRGKIYDCQLESLVDIEKEFLAAVTPGPESAATLFTALPQEEWEALQERMTLGRPFTLPVNGADLAGEGVQIFPSTQRYTSQQTAAHVLGYLGADGGVTGIEQAYDTQLKATGGRLLLRYTMSAAGQPLPGSAPQLAEDTYQQTGGVVLTLDRDIQQAAEEAAARHFEKGAVVVMDVYTGDLKAVVSLPTYDPNNVAVSLQDTDAPMINRALWSYNVGSTFKLLVAATAVEQGYSSHTNFCSGEIEVEGVIFRCHNLSGHGELDLQGALEKSCNPYFISLMQKTGSASVLHKATELGFGRSQELAPGMQTAAGTLPTYDDIKSPPEEANFAFGQGKLSATPIQISRLVAAIANGGSSVTPRLVAGFTEDGQQLSSAQPVYAGVQVITNRAARIIQEDMIAVVETGSGKKAKPSMLGAGGKTSSAQTGRYDEHGEEIVHAWFAGFYPADNPLYSIVVLAEGMESGGDYAAPVFAEICDAILENGKLLD